MGLGNWYFTKYKISSGIKVLELGCGTGSMWIGHKNIIEKCEEVVLSDGTLWEVQTALCFR